MNKDELMIGKSKEIEVPWWNSEDDVVIQTSQETVNPLPFVVIGSDNDYMSDLGFDDEPEFGTW
jgi:hypothetical protein